MANWPFYTRVRFIFISPTLSHTHRHPHTKVIMSKIVGPWILVPISLSSRIEKSIKELLSPSSITRISKCSDLKSYMLFTFYPLFNVRYAHQWHVRHYITMDLKKEITRKTYRNLSYRCRLVQVTTMSWPMGWKWKVSYFKRTREKK